MNYAQLKPFEFHRNGHANRRDSDAQPRVLVTGMELDEHRVHFHIAGEIFISSAPVAELVNDEEFISVLEPMEALRIGIEFERQRWMNRNKESG